MGAGYKDKLDVTGWGLGLWPCVASNSLRIRALTGSWVAAQNQALTYYQVMNSSPANGHSMEFDIVGSLAILLCDVGTSHPIIDVYVDNVLKAQGVDLYSAISRLCMPVAFIDGLTPGKHVLKIVVNGKNASSTGYQVICTGALTDLAPPNFALYNDVNVRAMPTTTTVVPQVASSNTGFWNAAAVSAGGTSTAVYTQGSRLRVLVNSSAATEITVQHSADNTNWYDGETISFTAPGTKTLVVDCCYYVRLKSSQAATITAGYIYLRG